jgi:tRNA-Thr(GGU) m(6)t(6)A37 methyltransferase TsaA
MEPIQYKPVGIIHSPHKEIQGMPIQPIGAKGIKGSLTVFPEFEKCLTDIEGFSHLILLYHFHKITHWEPEVLPFMDTQKHGIFATRAPARPNPIGVSIVKLINRMDNILNIEEVDILDGTPVIDIKPFYGLYDNRDEYSSGWIENLKNTVDASSLRSDERFK